MRTRYWLWVGARLLAAVAIVGWAASYLGTGSGEKEFQKTLDAMKQVHSFRVAFSASQASGHSESLSEVDCDQDIMHLQSHFVDATHDPAIELSKDEVGIAGRIFDHQSDGSWAPAKYGGGHVSARLVCAQLAQGAETHLLPQIATMIKRGILQKGDKKTVNGVRCREWLVTMKGGFSGLEHDTVCLGLEDHLPYEMTVDWEHSHSSFSDYNAPIKIDVPEAALQPASTDSRSN